MLTLVSPAPFQDHLHSWWPVLGRAWRQVSYLVVGPLTYLCETLPRCLLVAGSLLYVVVAAWLWAQRLPPHSTLPRRSVAWPHDSNSLSLPTLDYRHHLSGPWKLPFLGFEAQSWPSNKTLLCVWFSSSSLAFTHCIIVYISCFSAVKFSEHSIQSCVHKPKAQVTCIGFMSWLS